MINVLRADIRLESLVVELIGGDGDVNASILHLSILIDSKPIDKSFVLDWLLTSFEFANIGAFFVDDFEPLDDFLDWFLDFFLVGFRS